MQREKCPCIGKFSFAFKVSDAEFECDVKSLTVWIKRHFLT